MLMSLGLDIGSYAVKLCVLDQCGALRMLRSAPHQGLMAETAARLLRQALDAFGREALSLGALTGAGAQSLEDAALRVDDIAALAEGASRLAPECRSVAAIGAQSAIFLTGVRPGDRSQLRFALNSSCAAGTGSFLDEQASRIGIAIENYGTRALTADSFPRIAGRCSVFAKTDITHHQQEGTPVEEVLLGLAHAVARNYRTSVLRRLPLAAPLLFAGGLAQNLAVVQALREQLGVTPEEFVVSPDSPLAGAIGAAGLALSQMLPLDPGLLLNALQGHPGARRGDGASLPPLGGFGRGDADGRHDVPSDHGPVPLRAYLGVDVGSTSTNLVLLDADGAVLDLRYLRTLGEPERAVRRGLAQFEAAHPAGIQVLGVGVTGSGRNLMGRLLGADVVRDEITAQARAASALAPGANTVFEIGGQDSKFIALRQDRVADFQMNKVCAAGTGSFLEEQAKKLGIGLEDLAGLALASQAPEDLGERCTVFMEARVAARRAQGASLEDIAAGLCYAVARNYLNRVAAGRNGDGPALLQGGLAYNQGVVNAFRALTGGEIIVPPYFSVTGAVGAALLAREEMPAGPSRFRGFRPAQAAKAEPPAASDAFTRDIAALVFGPESQERLPGRLTIGVPRALFSYGMYPMFSAFFESLGCNLLLSGQSTERTVALAQEHALDETCFPVKLVNGHVAELVERGVDALFFPDLHSVHHHGASARRSFGCAYMQQAYRMVEQAMALRRRGVRLLAPRIAFSLGGGFLRGEFIAMGRELGFEDGRSAQALGAALAAHEAFQERMAVRREEVLAALDPGRRTFVLISKIYGVADPLLNLGIPGILAESGEQVLPFHMLPGTDMSAAHPNMFWPFGQHILEAAATCARRPDLHAILLTHHGCGPDSILGHYVRAIMGEKPFLAVEVDEHRSCVGVQTRVEAFLNSVRSGSAATSSPVVESRQAKVERLLLMPPSLAELQSEAELLLPDLPPYSGIGQALLRARGATCRVLPPTDTQSLARGRAYTVTNESPALAALLGDAICALRPLPTTGPATALLLPQCEGTETDGQFARFLRLILDAEGLERVAVVSPFLEDLALAPQAETIFLCLLAGDVALAAPPAQRQALLERLRAAAGKSCLDQKLLASMAMEAADAATTADVARGHAALTVFATGEPLTLFNDRLHGGVLAEMEAGGIRVLRAPLSEALWSLWHQYSRMDGSPDGLDRRLSSLAAVHAAVAAPFRGGGPFLERLDALPGLEDEALGLYSGAFGRYRAARAANPGSDAMAVLALCPMYENTGVALEIADREPRRHEAAPVLHLAFDGQGDAAVRFRLTTFLNTLKERRTRR